MFNADFLPARVILPVQASPVSDPNGIGPLPAGMEA